MAAHLSEEEQIEALKRWWKDNGTTTVIALVVLAAIFFGWNQYQDYREGQADEASELYQRFLVATEALESEQGEAVDTAEVTQLAEQIIQQYDETLYADFARLYQARLAVQSGDAQKARQLLQQVSDQGANESVKSLARLRLGRVIAEQGETDAALALLTSNVPESYASAYAEARGDILLAEQRFAEARTAYQSALQDLTDPRSMRRNIVQLKIDNTRTTADVPDVLPSQAPANPHATPVNPHGTPPSPADGATPAAANDVAEGS